MKNIFNALAIAASVMSLTLGSCKKEEDKKQLTIPSSYTSADFDANTVTEFGVRNRLAAFSAYMKKGESVVNKLNADSLNHYFAVNGPVTLSSITAAYYDNLVKNSWLQVLVSCSGNNYDPAKGDTATNGGVYGARLLDKRAKETLQEIEKGLYASALYNHLLTLAQGPITAATVDKMIAIYGAHPNFPNTNTASKTTTPDVVIALYTARRDKNDGNGLYSQIKNNFIKLKAAVEAGADYNQERDEAFAGIKLGIEKAIMATVVNYGYTAITKLSTTSPPAATISGGLHDLSECVGFIHGFKAIPQANRKITDTEIDELLAFLNSPAGADATMYKFVTDGVTELAKITQLQNKIKSIYGFSSAEMEDFKQNWISVQGR